MIQIEVTQDMVGKTLTLYETRDAQDFLGISSQTLYRWRADGWLKPWNNQKIGVGYVYEQEDLEKCLVLRNKDREYMEVEVG